MLKKGKMTMTTQSQDKAALDRLWDAAKTGDSATIRVLALGGVDLDARNEDDLTALHLARRHNHPSTVRAILAAREFQYLRKVGVELKRIGNSNNPAAWKHYKA
jgi:hypothetical protein